jgi:hypothetical protein
MLGDGGPGYEKTYEHDNEDAGDSTKCYKGQFPCPEPHIQAPVMQRPVEARAVGMRIVHGEHFPHGPLAVRLVAHQIFTYFDARMY